MLSSEKITFDEMGSGAAQVQGIIFDRFVWWRIISWGL